MALAIARPVQWGCLVRRLGARQRHDLRRGFRRDRRLAGLARLVAQQTLNPALGKALLPPPYRRPADADTLRHPLRYGPIPPNAMAQYLIYRNAVVNPLNDSEH
jgi:hypothetical protein